MNDLNDLFGEPIYSYTRRQAIEDGVLVDVDANFGTMRREAGLVFPVAMTATAFAEYVNLTPAAERAGNDINGRMWDVLNMLAFAIRRSVSGGSEIAFQLRVVTDRVRPSLVTLKAVVGPGDAGEPVITIMRPDED